LWPKFDRQLAPSAAEWSVVVVSDASALALYSSIACLASGGSSGPINKHRHAVVVRVARRTRELPVLPIRAVVVSDAAGAPGLQGYTFLFPRETVR
jgi:hypothetical protein